MHSIKFCQFCNGLLVVAILLVSLSVQNAAAQADSEVAPPATEGDSEGEMTTGGETSEDAAIPETSGTNNAPLVQQENAPSDAVPATGQDTFECESLDAEGFARLEQEKPKTAERMRKECSEYIPSVMSRAQRKEASVSSLLFQQSSSDPAAAGSGSSSSSAKHHRYWMGISVGDKATLQINDLAALGEALLNNPLGNCFDYMLLGVCWTYSATGVRVTPYVEYRWPEQRTEAAKDKAMTAYLLDGLAKAKGQMHESILGWGLDLAQGSGLGGGGGGSGLPGLGGSSGSDYRDIIKPGLESLPMDFRLPPVNQDQSSASEMGKTEGTRRDFEERALNVDGAGFMRTEYRVQRLGAIMEKLEDQIDQLQLPFIWEGFCHDRKEDAKTGSETCTDGCFWSEDEGYELSRHAYASMSRNSDAMEQKTSSPLACILYNMRSDADEALKTPEDLLSPLSESIHAADNLQKYCSTGNQGNQYALLSNIATLDRRTATEQAVLRGTDAPGSEAGQYGLYEYIDEFRGGKEKDHDDQVQWTNDSTLEDKFGSGECVDLTPASMHYPRDFTLEQRDVDTVSKSDNYGGDGEVDPFWAVAHQWHRFRCCNGVACMGTKCSKKIRD